MWNLSKAIYAKAAGTAFMTAVGNRFYDTEAPQNARYPYCAYQIVTDLKEWQFTERFEDVVVQFSIFSTASSSQEGKDIWTEINTVYDEKYLTITGMTQFLWMWRDTTTVMKDEITTPRKGTATLWHIAMDFNVFYEV